MARTEIRSRVRHGSNFLTGNGWAEMTITVRQDEKYMDDLMRAIQPEKLANKYRTAIAGEVNG